MKYTLATGTTKEELEQDVATWLELGYVPQGGVARAATLEQWENRDGMQETNTRCTFAQAMVLLSTTERMTSKL